MIRNTATEVADQVSGQNRDPYMFVVGCERSGTTLLQRMLDAHPDLAVANDAHFIITGIDWPDTKEDPVITPRMVESVRTYRSFFRLGLSEEAVDRAAANANTYGEFVSGLFYEFRTMHGKKYSGEKAPPYIKRLGLLNALFHETKFLHIVRDGRDVLLSTRDWTQAKKHKRRGPSNWAHWDEEPIGLCALWWAYNVETGRYDAQFLESRLYREIKYEDLVAKPEETIRAISQFLD